ncbi:MAG: type I DNA topoisomerase [Candidatus Harrisonbacteria bacterium CG10_big_fil_rev_8_21_14_0_10_44_23]|uniref:DNA topoisomerase 1 n=1 Tax=Candidatus Harrisonbacteria bacterium CG10_big_fil_rev_8_21_14_0_10_44_23 TaxID=1974585 RepID=A0A2H0UQQ0_9BACT|nr:MAG: type I DNA topoisomerase [Candidatus Harrisonbacteria bacterium CG10_big_fil_rev_8_21_14_0_10_44_23]
MTKKLVIVESPTKAKTISKFLPKDYKVESSYGHVRDLPKSQLGVDVENNYEPKYVTPRKSQKQVTHLKELALKCDEVILASDEDREGEAIAWHLGQILQAKTDKRKTKVNEALKAKQLPISRIVFHEITKSAIEDALKNPRKILNHLVDAQQARRVLDRLVGYKLSPFLWQKVAKGLSAGRVQSVALRLIVDRENEIRAFNPQEYWSIDVQLANQAKAEFISFLFKIDDQKLDRLSIESEIRANEINKDLEKASYKISHIKKTETRKHPSPPFTTSTLQQQAASRLRFSAKKTMMLAQSLYENGHITYMRTDSFNLSAESLTAAKNYIHNTFGQQYALEQPRRFKNKSKLSQEAHEAIRPTKVTSPEEIGLASPDEAKLYQLIWQRFIASQMPSALFDSTQIEIIANGEKEYTLKTNGLTLKFDGYLKVYPTKFQERELPELNESDALDLIKVISEQHFTEPPARYNEAKLIKTLEEFGIGRPSTYVPIISVIQARNYAEKDAGRFKPTEIGEMVIKLLIEHFPQIVDVNFTAELEGKLDKVAEGETDWREIIGDFYIPFSKLLEEKLEDVEKEVADEKTDEKCEKCGKDMVIKFGRFGKFLACTGFPECKTTKTLDKKHEPKETGFNCPECPEGKILEKTTHRRNKTFWGCSNYPDCDFATWTNPNEETPVARTEEEKEKAREKAAKRKARKK